MTDKPNNNDEPGELLSAYLDNELTPDERASAERLLHKSAAARRKLDELRGAARRIAELPRHEAPDSIMQDVQACVERSTLLDGSDVTVDESPERRAPLLTLLSTAAAIALVLGGVWYLAGDRGGTADAVRETVAMAPTETSLEEQLRTPGRYQLDAARSAESGRKERSVDAKAARGKRARRRTSTSVESPAMRNDAPATKLVATASLAQKLAAGFDASAIRAHPFRNEPLVLRLAAKTESQRNAVAARLIERLRASGVAALPDASSKGNSRSLENEAFFFQGNSHINFGEGGGKQILVHASREQLRGVLDQLRRAERDGAKVELRAGPVTLTGFDRTRQALMPPGRSVGARESYAAGGAADDALIELADAIGLDPGVFVPTRHDAPAGRSTITLVVQLSTPRERGNSVR